VRFQKLLGHEVHYVCADDTHGTPIMLRAEAEGIAPKKLIERVWHEHKRDFDGFHVGFDNYYSTDSPENRAFCEDIYAELSKRDLIAIRSVEQFYDPVKQMFLPDRYIKGDCPKCGARDQYGDSCEVCGSTYAPTDLKNPYSVVSGAKPERRASEHHFFRLSEERCETFLRRFTQAEGRLQPEAANKMKEWLGEPGDNRLADWDISRDPPYFGFPIPGTGGKKFFYVWLDAPVGYFASFANYVARRRAEGAALAQDDFLRPAPIPRWCISSARTSFISTLCSGRRCSSTRATAPPRRSSPTASHRERREDVEEPRHLHHRRELPAAGTRSGVAALLLRGQARADNGRH